MAITISQNLPGFETMKKSLHAICKWGFLIYEYIEELFYKHC